MDQDLRKYREEEKQLSSKYLKRFIILLICTIAATLLSFWIGYYPLSPKQVLQAFLSGIGVETDVVPQAVTIFWSVRLPRIISALLIGAALSTSGAVYQGMFQNPLVSPDILGVSSGASFGAALSIFLGLPHGYTQIFAFVGGIAAVAVSYIVSQKSSHSQLLSLILTGTMVGALCNASVTMIKYLSDPNNVLQQITFWLMGSLTKVTMEGIRWSIIPMLIGFVTIILMRWQVNVLSLSEEEIKSMGINPKIYRLILITAATLLSASAVCLGGLIGWVGLMVPHMARRIFGSDFQRLLPGCILLGGTFLLLMDDIARSLMRMEIPIGVVTSFLGAPFFIALILRRKEI